MLRGLTPLGAGAGGWIATKVGCRGRVAGGPWWRAMDLGALVAVTCSAGRCGRARRSSPDARQSADERSYACGRDRPRRHRPLRQAEPALAAGRAGRVRGGGEAQRARRARRDAGHPGRVLGPVAGGDGADPARVRARRGGGRRGAPAPRRRRAGRRAARAVAAAPDVLRRRGAVARRARAAPGVVAAPRRVAAPGVAWRRRASRRAARSPPARRRRGRGDLSAARRGDRRPALRAARGAVADRGAARARAAAVRARRACCWRRAVLTRANLLVLIPVVAVMLGRRGAWFAVAALVPVVAWSINVGAPVTTGGGSSLFVGTYLPGGGTLPGAKRALKAETIRFAPALRGRHAKELPGDRVLDAVAAREPGLDRDAALRHAGAAQPRDLPARAARRVRGDGGVEGAAAVARPVARRDAHVQRAAALARCSWSSSRSPASSARATGRCSRCWSRSRSST